tara:strand:- start:756 stop:1583 length:828 start_codon:yes stop_codon:yes gene_type:complete
MDNKKLELNNIEVSKTKKKILILYAMNKYNKASKKFIEQTIYYHPKIDFYIIFNGLPNNVNYNVPIYAKTLFRKNLGFDFGAWGDALLKHNFYKRYKYFIFLNDSVNGPYVNKWPWKFIENLNKNNIKLFGCTINALKKYKNHINAHVQSCSFCMDKECLEYLIKVNIFTENYCEGKKNKWNTIREKELEMSNKVLSNNWNIGCFHKYYDNIDFTNLENLVNSKNFLLLGDINYPIFKDILWTNQELIFTKGNREKQGIESNRERLKLIKDALNL